MSAFLLHRELFCTGNTMESTVVIALFPHEGYLNHFRYELWEFAADDTDGEPALSYRRSRHRPDPLYKVEPSPGTWRAVDCKGCKLSYMFLNNKETTVPSSLLIIISVGLLLGFPCDLMWPALTMENVKQQMKGCWKMISKAWNTFKGKNYRIETIIYLSNFHRVYCITIRLLRIWTLLVMTMYDRM